MEVREPGARYLVAPTHQQTELGELPVDWLTPQLGEITRNMRLGGNYKNGQEMSPWPLIKMGNLGRGSITLGHLEYIDSKTAPSPEHRLRTSDVLFNTRNTLDLVGKVAIWRDEIPEAYFNSNIARIEFDRAHVASNACMAYMLNTPRALISLRGLATGTTSVAAIYGRDLVKLKLPLPPKAEQVAIASALDDTDALIESLEQLLAKKRQIKQGAMQELLTGQRRLPGFSKPWVATVLGDIGSCARGVTYNPEADLRDGDHLNTLRLLRSNNVQNSAVQFAEMQYVDERRVSPDQVLRNDDLLVCMANGSRELVGKAGRFAEADEHRYTFGAFMARFRPEPDVVAPAFAAFVFQTYRYRAHINLLLAGSSINNLTPAGLNSFNFDLPADLAEQTAIATTLSDMDAEISAIEARLAKTRQLKQGMAQALLTGRIRLV